MTVTSKVTVTWVANLLPQLLLEGLGQRRDDLVYVAYHAVARHLEDGRIGVLVDRHDDLAGAHPGQVLDRARDAIGDVK